jgi:hypothetical protein
MSNPRTFTAVEIIDICDKGDLNQLQTAITTSDIDCSNLDINLFHGAVRHPAIIEYLTDPTQQIYKAFNHGLHDIHADAFAGRSTKVLDTLNNTPYLLILSSLKGYGVFYWASLGRNYALIDILLTKITNNKKDEYIEQITVAADYLMEVYNKANDSTTAYLIETKANIYQKQLTSQHPSVTISEIKESDWLEDGPLMEDVSTTVTEPQEKIEQEFYSTPRIEKTVADWGFFPRDVRHDGNCQFYAISDQIMLHRDKFPPEHQQHNHVSLRKLAVDHLRENSKLYFDYETETPEKYLQKMQASNHWGDHLTIVALSAELNVNIAVYSTNAPATVIKLPDAYATLFILHQNRTHYSSLEIIDADLVNNTIVKHITDDIQVSTLAMSSTKVSTATQWQLSMIATSAKILLLPRHQFFSNNTKSQPWRTVEEEIDGEDQLSEPDDMIANLSTFEVAKRIANPVTDLIDEMDLTQTHNLNDFSIAIMRADNELMDAIFLSDPGVIHAKTDDAFSMFFWAGLTNNDYLIKLCDEPTAVQRNEFIDGATQRANHLNWEDTDHPECINAHEYVIQALLSAINCDPSETYFSALHELKQQLFTLLLKYKNELLQEQNDAEAIVVLKKAITNYPAQHASATISLKTLQAELDDLQAKMEVENIIELLGRPNQLFDPKKKRSFEQTQPSGDETKRSREKRRFR